MPRTRRVPQRTCVGCGEVDGKRELVRLVRTPEGAIALDPTGKRNGRGAYLHRDAACLERAASRLPHALRVEAPLLAAAWPGLRQAFAGLLAAPVRRRPLVHRAPIPLPEHLIARGRRGPARTAARHGGGAPPGAQAAARPAGAARQATGPSTLGGPEAHAGAGGASGPDRDG